jgi:hypothetical protein
MYEVAERFYMELIPQAREMAAHAISEGHGAEGRAVNNLINEILDRPEHVWFEEGAEGQAQRIQEEMARRYGRSGE